MRFPVFRNYNEPVLGVFIIQYWSLFHGGSDGSGRREIIVRGQSYFSRLPKYWWGVNILEDERNRIALLQWSLYGSGIYYCCTCAYDYICAYTTRLIYFQMKYIKSTCVHHTHCVFASICCKTRPFATFPVSLVFVHTLVKALLTIIHQVSIHKE